ncbi:GTP 3',8-cyclase MoaA [Thalassotalea aquiviva]|uniref:GTP 3',8-cyclase MoaA n=1 Tax=Thalassotalea aquiviva TaxID=3242415 RepID=UPI00352A9724
MLQDSYGRTFKYLRLSVTDVCNYKCNYCLPDGYGCSEKVSHLSVGEIKKLVSAFADMGVEKVRITGGEPALRRDLGEIISSIKSIPGIKTVALTTNGHKLENHIADWAERGLDAINVSCDSLDPRMFEAITGRQKLDQILKAIRLAHGLIDSVKVNVVILKQFNLSQFERFVQWVKTESIAIRFIELMQTADNQVFFSQNHVSSSKLQQKLKEGGWQPKRLAVTAGPAQEYWHPEFKGRLGFISPYAKDFCNTCNRLRISSVGKLHLCLFSEQGHELRPLLKQVTHQQLCAHIEQLLSQKVEAHQLQQGSTGLTSHLAMIGG